MATQKSKKLAVGGIDQSTKSGYRGKQTRTGNSSGFRFEGALFRSHPEFNGDVRAHIIAPGRMLVVAEPAEQEQEQEEDDPVLAAFLALLAKDIEEHPEQLIPLDEELANRAAWLTRGMNVSIDEDLGDDPLLDELFL
jgi:hypothetical protein